MSLDDGLYRKTINEVLLKCLGEEQAKVAVWEVHDGICIAHQSAHMMNWLLQRTGFYWPTMMDDCIKYQRGVRGVLKVREHTISSCRCYELNCEAMAILKMGT
jgi:hypothetical protein